MMVTTGDRSKEERINSDHHRCGNRSCRRGHSPLATRDGCGQPGRINAHRGSLGSSPRNRYVRHGLPILIKDHRRELERGTEGHNADLRRNPDGRRDRRSRLRELSLACSEATKEECGEREYGCLWKWSHQGTASANPGDGEPNALWKKVSRSQSNRKRMGPKCATGRQVQAE